MYVCDMCIFLYRCVDVRIYIQLCLGIYVCMYILQVPASAHQYVSLYFGSIILRELAHFKVGVTVRVT